jgi:Zn-dependent protease with chaperone function
MPCNLAIADTARWIARRAARAGAPPMPTVEELDDMYPAAGAMAGLAYV